MLPLAVLALGAVLVVAWVVASRRHLERRAQVSAEWDAGEQRPDLWTSEASCVHCGAKGGLVEAAGDSVVYLCLSCGQRHVRSTRA